MNLDNSTRNTNRVSKYIKELLLRLNKVENTVENSEPVAQVNSDWNALTGPAQILNKPTIAAPSYKVYSALISQTGTNAPTAIVLENTLGGPVSFSRYGVGGYTISSNSLFTFNKTFFSRLSGLKAGTGGYDADIQFNGASTSNLNLEVKNVSGVNVDGIVKAPLEIRVYN